MYVTRADSVLIGSRLFTRRALSLWPVSSDKVNTVTPTAVATATFEAVVVSIQTAVLWRYLFLAAPITITIFII